MGPKGVDNFVAKSRLYLKFGIKNNIDAVRS